MTTTMADPPPTTCTTIVVAAPTIQIVTKASSDQLLSKFADSDDGPRTKKKKMISMLADRRKRLSSRRESGEFLEKKSLLPPAFGTRRKLGIGRGRTFKSKSIFLADIRKTWKRTVEGASRMFMEKHYNMHKRLISDSLPV